MKDKLTNFMNTIYNISIWRWMVLAMLLIFIGGFLYFSINYFESGRPEVMITNVELKNGKINYDLTQTDESASSATFEDYNIKLNSLKAKMPYAEWDKLETKKIDPDYQQKYARYLQERMSYFGEYAIEPVEFEIISLPYSMKKFMNDIMLAQKIDSVDFEAKIVLLDKIDHLYSITDKISVDSILVDKFLGTLQASKNLTLQEMIEVEKLHKSITNISLLFRCHQTYSKQERQEEYFELYDHAANTDVTADRFEQLNRIVTKMKTELKIKDTVAILKAVSTAMNVNFSQYKYKNESVDKLELQCVEDFFFGDKIKFKAIDLQDKFTKYIQLFGQKIEAANFDKRAREILREENRNTAKDWMYFGFFFLLMTVMIVFLAKMNSTFKNIINN